LNRYAAAAAKAAVRAAAEAEKAAVAAGGSWGSGGVGVVEASTGWRGAVRLLAESGDPDTAARLAGLCTS
jgi:hypothetical protein